MFFSAPRLARRIQTGDLREWTRELDGYRHDVTAKTLLPVDWSPIQEVDFATVPTDGREHELHLFMEDTGWPTSSLERRGTSATIRVRRPSPSNNDSSPSARSPASRREKVARAVLPSAVTAPTPVTTTVKVSRAALR